jgi:P27 family predicted phage terminase small subunit
VKQRGRKTTAALLSLSGPRLIASQPIDEPPPSPPPHLGEPEQRIWRGVTADYAGTPASFAVLCSGLEAHQRARECREIIECDGMVVTGRDGQTKAHPLINAERDARRAFQQTFKALGIKI